MDLSILIPARNEMFIDLTVADILKNIRGDTEVIVVLDGYTDPVPDIPKDDRVRILTYEKSIGQRAATNAAARLSEAKYLMKVDAHCAFDEGFDIKMMDDMRENWTMAPLMRNLHVFDWVCEDGHRRYQGPSGPCLECKKPTHREILWRAKPSPQSVSYCFDSTPHFQYFREYNHRPEGKGNLTESMSLQGSCFMLTRQKYWELEICDEKFGSWGSQGIEVAVKTWLSGGKVIISHKTWYAHLFRTQGGDFSFPYPISGNQVENAKRTARELFFDNKWPKQIYPLSWLLDRFWPVPGWSEEDLNKLRAWPIQREIPMRKKKPTLGAIYYTDNLLPPRLMALCQQQLCKSFSGKLVSSSLKPIDFGRNIVLELERGYLAMFKQILAALQAIDTDVVFFCEHDILYHPSHFDFVPAKDTVFYYNTNVWKVRMDDGLALYCKGTQQTSGLVAYRQLLLEHYEKRVERVAREGHFDRHIGFEPGTHSFPRGIDNYSAESYFSAFPNLDIRHSTNLTPNRWRKDQFRNQKYTEGWTESYEVPGWGATLEVLKDVQAKRDV